MAIGLVAEEARVSILEGDSGHQNFPALVPLAPTQFAAFRISEIPFSPGPPPVRTDQELAQVLLTQTQVKAQPDQKIGSHGLGRCTRKSSRIGHPPQNLVSDLSILTKRAFGLKDRQNGFEGITVNATHTLDLLCPGQAEDIQPVASLGPVGANGFDIVLRDKTRHRSERVGEVRGLSDPAGILPGERDADVEHLQFPAGVKPPPLQAPLQIPIPHTWEDQEREAQAIVRHPSPANGTGSACVERTEHEAEVLDFLPSRLGAPDATTLIPERRQGRGLERTRPLISSWR